MDKEVKTYKDFNKVYIGESDMAKLVLVGVSHESGDVEASILPFGGDGDYSAYVIDELLFRITIIGLSILTIG